MHKWWWSAVLLGCDEGRDAEVDEACGEPSRECRLFIETVATRLSACGEDYDRIYRSLDAQVPCHLITSIRDCASYRGMCLPELSQWPCFDVVAGPAPPLPAACEGQLLAEPIAPPDPDFNEAGMPIDGDASF